MRRCANTGARSSRVSTACTPGAASAADFVIDLTSAWGCGLRTNATFSAPGTTMSSTKRPRPRSRASSSIRVTRDPISEGIFSNSDPSGGVSFRRGLGGFVGDVLGRRVDLGQQGVDLGRAHRIDIEVGGLGLGQEGAILQGLVEGGQ